MSAVGVLVGLGVRRKVLDTTRREVKTGLGEMERVRRQEEEERKARREGKKMGKGWGRGSLDGKDGVEGMAGGDVEKGNGGEGEVR